jgi:hypothetical protein
MTGIEGATKFAAAPLRLRLVGNQHFRSTVAFTGPAPIVADMSSPADAAGDGAAGDGFITDAGIDLATAPCNGLCPPSLCMNGVCAKRVFVSSVVHSASFGGLAGADQFCQQLADAAQLGGSYKAWISDDTGSPSTRFSQSSGPYILVDGSPVADNWSALIGGPLKSTIHLTEKGGAPPAATTNVICCPSGEFVWSNTKPQGAVYSVAASCDRWSNAAAMTGSMFGATGDATAWSYLCSGDGCGGLAPVFCFEQ